MASRRQVKSEILNFPTTDSSTIKKNVVVKGTVSSGEREWEMEFNAQEIEIMEEWIASKTICHASGKALEKSKKSALNVAMKQYSQYLWENKGKISNPKIRIYKMGKIDHEAMLIVADKYSVDITTPEVFSGKCLSDMTPVQRKNALARNLFMHLDSHVVATHKQLSDLLENEIDITENHYVRPMNELLEGVWKDGHLIPSTDIEKKVGEKLWAVLNGKSKVQLTEEDRKVFLVTEYQYLVQSGFLYRAWQYAKDETAMVGLFEVIRPVAYLAYQKFAVEDTNDLKNNRLMKAFSKLINI